MCIRDRVEGIQDIEDEKKPKKLPQIVIIVDELADLMMVAPGEVEEAICRLAPVSYTHLDVYKRQIEDSIQKKSGNCKPVIFSDSLTVNHLIQPYKGIPNPSYLVNQPLLNRFFSYQHRSQIPGQHLCIQHRCV